MKRWTTKGGTIMEIILTEEDFAKLSMSSRREILGIIVKSGEETDTELGHEPGQSKYGLAGYNVEWEHD